MRTLQIPLTIRIKPDGTVEITQDPDPSIVPVVGTKEERFKALFAEWDDQRLSQDEESAILVRHGFPPQMAGSLGRWGRTEHDHATDQRYVTEDGRQWVAGL